MYYKLLNNGTAVIINRHPEIVYKELRITFSGAPSNATAIIEYPGGSLFRQLKDEMCTIPIKKLNGEIKITVAILNDGSPIKWACEEIKAEQLNDGGVFVCPNDLNLPQVISDLRLENDNIREEQIELKSQIADLERRLDMIMEAYDFI